MYYGCVNKDCDRYYKKLDKDGYGEFKTSKKE